MMTADLVRSLTKAPSITRSIGRTSTGQGSVPGLWTIPPRRTRPDHSNRRYRRDTRIRSSVHPRGTFCIYTVAYSKWLYTTMARNDSRRRDCRPQVLAHKRDRVWQCHPENLYNSPPGHLFSSAGIKGWTGRTSTWMSCWWRATSWSVGCLFGKKSGRACIDR